VAVLYLDLDGFKSVNDRYGRRAGDEVLTTAAIRIEEALRPGDLTARLGGDEFGVICARLCDQAEAIAIAERLIESLGQPVTLPISSIRSADLAILAGAPVVDLPPKDGPIAVNVQVSIGIAFGPESGTDHEHLVELADAATYQAKRAGGGCWCLADAERPAPATRF
jgi:GGDEF domain-containing protein